MRARIQKFLQRFIEQKVVEKEVIKEPVYKLNDVAFAKDDYETISAFIKSGTGGKFIEHLRVQQKAVADSAAGHFENPAKWQGFVLGYKAAIDNIIIAFREPPVNGEISSNPNEVGLEELAEAIRPQEK
jgi:hypothetical protein